jgi:hypothetical protein
MPYQAWAAGDAAHDHMQRQIDLADGAAQGKRDIAVGGVWLGAGLVITLATMASGASAYIVAWGPMVYGLYRIIKGIVAVRRVG